MATRQYIGARYVPKFYDYNGSPNWRAGVEYENLTIVTRNGNSYTSKKPVPSSIGEPENNPEYWVSTGMYNEQVEAYRQLTQAVASRVEEVATESAQDVADEASAREQADTALGDRITENAETIEKARTVSEKYYILLGDSYNAENHYSWGQTFISRNNLTEGVNVWNLAMPGAGFGTGDSNNFYLGLQNIKANMTDAQAENITDVVIQGGANDWNSTEGNVSVGISNCENYVKQNFPHAKMYIICAGWCYALEGERNGLINAYNWYNEHSQFSSVFNRAYTPLLYPGALDTDMTHPTQASAFRIAVMIDNFVHGGNLYFHKYVGLRSVFGTLNILGDITPYGTHITNSAYSRLDYSASPITISNTPTVIATHEGTDSQNFFFRNAIFPGTALIVTLLEGVYTYNTIQCAYQVTKRENALTWDLYISNRSFLTGGFTIANVVGIYPLFDAWLDVTQT